MYFLDGRDDVVRDRVRLELSCLSVVYRVNGASVVGAVDTAYVAELAPSGVDQSSEEFGHFSFLVG